MIITNTKTSILIICPFPRGLLLTYPISPPPYSRYLDTAALVYSWYSSDCWEEESLSSSMIRRVNALHRFIAQKEFVR